MSVAVNPPSVGIAGVRLKTGRAERAVAIVTTHVPAPVQSGVVAVSGSRSTSQPAKVESAAGVAVSVTLTAPPNVASQVAPQLMPAGLEVMVPDPRPIRITLRAAASTATHASIANIMDTLRN